MLSLDVAVADLAGIWVRDGAAVAGGSSWIRPLSNPALETLYLTTDKRSLVVVRERAAGCAATQPTSVLPAGQYDRRRGELLDWPLEFCAAEIDHGCRLLRLHAGRWGTAPMHLAVAEDRLIGSWSLADLRPHLSGARLNGDWIVRYLGRRRNYSRETVFADVVRLTERAGAVFDVDGLALAYPSAAAHVQPRGLRPGADVAGAYAEILDGVLRRWDFGGPVAVELSGGLDSAMVALGAAELGPESVITCGILIGGDAGGQQIRRRQAMIARGGYQDISVAVLPPYNPGGHRAAGLPFGPEDEPYAEALDGELTAVMAAGPRVVLTGIGGDELLSLRPAEREPEALAAARRRPVAALLTGPARERLEALESQETGAPATVVNEPSLSAIASRSPVFLRHGCWPVSPLCAPELIQFCEWLPVEWRRGKRLHSELLRRAGHGGDVVTPPLRENFAHVMDAGLRAHGLPALRRALPGSVLVDAGYLDQDAVDRHLRQAMSDDRPEPLEGLYEAVTLELSLRSLQS